MKRGKKWIKTKKNEKNKNRRMFLCLFSESLRRKVALIIAQRLKYFYKNTEE